MVKKPSQSPKRTSASRRRRVLVVLSWWDERILRGIVSFARRAHWTIDFPNRRRHDTIPTKWSGDGVIVFARDFPKIARLVTKLQLPTVDLEAYVDRFGAPKVVGDDLAVGRMAGGHLMDQGFTTIGIVESPFQGWMLNRERGRGVREVVHERGGRVIEIPTGKLMKLLPTLPKPMGLMTPYDGLALDTIAACRDAGYRVPEEFAVVGVNDDEILCELTEVPVSSVNNDFERKGYVAAEMLERLMNGKPAPSNATVIPPTHVTIRRSTDIVAIPDARVASALGLLRQRCREPLQINDVIRSVPMARTRLQQLFRKYVGRTMHDELTRLRIDAAQVLLRTSDQKMVAVARACGFSNRFHFARAFTRLTGMTPDRFRRNQGSIGLNQRTPSPY